MVEILKVEPVTDEHYHWINIGMKSISKLTWDTFYIKIGFSYVLLILFLICLIELFTNNLFQSSKYKNHLIFKI